MRVEPETQRRVDLSLSDIGLLAYCHIAWGSFIFFFDRKWESSIHCTVVFLHVTFRWDGQYIFLCISQVTTAKTSWKKETNDGSILNTRGTMEDGEIDVVCRDDKDNEHVEYGMFLEYRQDEKINRLWENPCMACMHSTWNSSIICSLFLCLAWFGQGLWKGSCGLLARGTSVGRMIGHIVRCLRDDNLLQGYWQRIIICLGRYCHQIIIPNGKDSSAVRVNIFFFLTLL